MTATSEVGVRAEGSPLQIEYRRTNFMPVDQMDSRKKNSIINRRFITGIIPAIVFGAAIVVFAYARNLWAADELNRATIALDETKAIARYPLATRDLVQSRAIEVKQSADALDEHTNRVLLGIAPLVLLANALPRDVRISNVTFDPGHANVTQGEALAYNSIVKMSTVLQSRFPATVSTVTRTTADNSGNPVEATTWDWTGQILLNPPTPAPTVTSR
jgi:hypothetical protein